MDEFSLSRRRLLASGLAAGLAAATGCLGLGDDTANEGTGQELGISLTRVDGRLRERYVDEREDHDDRWDEQALEAALNGERYTTQHRRPFFASPDDPAYVVDGGTYYQLGSVVVDEVTETYPVLRLFETEETTATAVDGSEDGDLPEPDQRAVRIAHMAARARGNEGGFPSGLVQRGGYVYRREAARDESVLLAGDGPEYVTTRETTYSVEIARERFHEAVYRPTAEPITIQGDHGPVAFRHIRYRTYDDRSIEEALGPPPGNPIEVQVGAEPVVMRGFVSHPEATRVSFTGLPVVVDAVSIGTPEGPHYSVDLESGALLRVWKGWFLNTEQMWRHRGPDQTAQAMGSEITLSRAPPVAALEDPDAAWPDSAVERFASTGYALGTQGHPTFQYRLGDLRIEDRLEPVREGRGLARVLTVEGSANGTSGSSLWCRLASARTIEQVDEGLYAVEDRTYYVETSSREGLRIRNVPSGQELIVPVPAGDGSRTVRYTLLW
jgi:hypothetical protein